MEGQWLGFIQNREGWPDDPDHEDVYEYVRKFSETDWAMQVLGEIEQFGLPGVDSAADLTHLQSLFLQLAKNERNRRSQP